MFVSTQSSSFIDYICADVVKGIVSVYFKNDNGVERRSYKNVSRRAITNLMVQPNMSLGFWFNKNINYNNRVSYAA